ncbi:MAG: hypothetical protein WCR02_03510 [Sphaerochaetaceae bacterium]
MPLFSHMRSLSDDCRVLVFRDFNENEKTRFNCRRSIKQGKQRYT